MTVVGIDVSKGKSMVAAMKPGGELVAAPYEVRHSDIELSHLALDVLCMEPDTRVVMEATGRYHEPVGKFNCGVEFQGVGIDLFLEFRV